ASGPVPANRSEVSGRINEIRYSSGTRMVTEEMRRSQYMRHVMTRLLETIPEEQRKEFLPCRLAEEMANNKRYNVIHLIYRNQPYEQHYKDYQFGRVTMKEHWRSGLEDIRQTLKHKDRLSMPDNLSGFATYDVHRDEIEERLANGK